MKRNAIECAHLEIAKLGHFEQKGRNIYFHSTVTRESYIWTCKTEKEAKETLTLFRAAPKYTTQEK